MDPIVIESLSKSYGTFAAVRDLSLSVPAGSICGLLGPNGAGKSTTFKCMLGLARLDNGRVFINGSVPTPTMFESLAFVPERSALYDQFSARDHMDMTRRAFATYDESRAQKMLAMFDLNPRKRISTFSKGQRTALALVLAFSTRPQIMILDEPASGLDPVHQRGVLDLLIEAAAHGTTILLSSHQIGQVERAADRVVILKRGAVVLEGVIDDLREREKVIEAVFAGPVQDARFDRDPRIRRVERRGRTLRLSVFAEHAAVAREVESLQPTTCTVLDQNLEEIFFSAVEEPRATLLEAD